jgi:hypothetical protein
MPGSVWDLPHRMWLIFAEGADAWAKANREKPSTPAGQGSIRARVGR